MTFERNDCYMKLRNLYDECKRCLYFHVILTMADGTTFDGIIEDVDMDNITVLAGEEVIEGENKNQPSEQRQYYGYGCPRRKFRRFRRRKFPLGNLIALSLLPYATPLPYPYYPYF